MQQIFKFVVFVVMMQFLFEKRLPTERQKRHRALRRPISGHDSQTHCWSLCHKTTTFSAVVWTWRLRHSSVGRPLVVAEFYSCCTNRSLLVDCWCPWHWVVQSDWVCVSLTIGKGDIFSRRRKFNHFWYKDCIVSHWKWWVNCAWEVANPSEPMTILNWNRLLFFDTVFVF